jgi:hypothetical protein
MLLDHKVLLVPGIPNQSPLIAFIAVIRPASEYQGIHGPQYRPDSIGRELSLT